jgi:ABC-type antimicrobial peptide transport system permease subunit
LAAAITGEARALNPDTLVSEVVRMNQQIDSTLRSERLISMLSSAFGVLALMLSAVGLYGVISYSVHRRTSEIGIRMALGARPEVIAWGVVRQTIVLVAGGIGVGLVGALLAARAFQSLLFGLSAADPLSYIAGAGVMLAVAVITSFLPARRASGIDPMQALRHQ